MHILFKAGFTTDAVSVKTQTRKIGILKDIIQESYQGYSAIIVGRSGMSRLKDLILKSMAYKLAAKIKHMPVVIVAGKPLGRRILIALDDSIEAMRGVSCMGALAGSTNPEITLCYCLEPTAKTGQDHQDWLQYHENRFKPYMEEATQRLVDAGVSSQDISKKFLSIKGNSIQTMIEAARIHDFTTVVVGRRESISIAQQYIRGRFAEKVIKSLNNMAVWVVN
jgi:nucleotide-binding universal stress UspA family protein